jgi:putative DNA primase/helicase
MSSGGLTAVQRPQDERLFPDSQLSAAPGTAVDGDNFDAPEANARQVEGRTGPLGRVCTAKAAAGEGAAMIDLDLFRASFARVSDAYGIEMPYGPKAERKPLTDDLLRAHLDGGPRIGAYCIDAEGLNDQIIIDIDIPKEKVNDPPEWEKARAAAKAVLAVFADLGIEAFITSSKSRGYHVRALWEVTFAVELRRLGNYIIRRAGIQAEVFPKQDQRGGEDKLGNFVWLPLHGESLKAGKTAILDSGNGLDPMPDQWEALRDIRRNSIETLASAIATMEETDGPVTTEKREPVRDTIPVNFRRDTLTRIAGANRRLGLGETEIYPILAEVNRTRCDPPVSDKHVRDIAKGIPLRYAPSAPIVGEDAVACFNLTDAGNAKRLVAYLNGLDRYCNAWKCWLIYDGTRWVKDDTGLIFLMAKETVAGIYAEAQTCKDEARRKAVASHAMRSETERSIRAMISLAQSEPGIPIRPADLDRHNNLVNVLNGTINVITGKLQPHDPADLITQLIPISYDEEAVAPRWKQFLREVFKDRQELIDFVQRLLGYCLTGETKEQMFAIWHGDGSNGKSVLLDTLREILADYATSTPFSTFALHRQEGIRNDLACLHNVRLVTSSEAAAGVKLDEELIKRATGDATIKARYLFSEYFEYQRRFKIIVAVNNLPQIRGTDFAIWRRVRLVPFDAVFTGDNCDLDLKEKLLAEAPGILTWLVIGAMLWHDMGLGFPDAVKRATEQYKAGEDTLACFLAESCELDATRTQPARALYVAFKEFCGGKTISEKVFSTSLTKQGYEKTKGSGGMAWHGLKLLPDAEPRPKK